MKCHPANPDTNMDVARKVGKFSLVKMVEFANRIGLVFPVLSAADVPWAAESI